MALFAKHMAAFILKILLFSDKRVTFAVPKQAQFNKHSWTKTLG